MYIYGDSLYIHYIPIVYHYILIQKHHNFIFKPWRSPSPTILFPPRRKWPRKSFAWTLPCGRVCKRMLDARRNETSRDQRKGQTKTQWKMGIQLDNQKKWGIWVLEMAAKFGRWRQELQLQSFWAKEREFSAGNLWFWTSKLWPWQGRQIKHFAHWYWQISAANTRIPSNFVFH